MPSSPLADLLNTWAAQADDNRKLGSLAGTIQQYGFGQQPGQPQPVPQPAAQQTGGFLSNLLGVTGGPTAPQQPQPGQDGGFFSKLLGIGGAPQSPAGAPMNLQPAAAPQLPLVPNSPGGAGSPASTPAASAPAVGGYMPRSAAMAAFGPQPDNVPSGVPMYGRSSADGLPTFAALQGAPTSRVTPDNASGLFGGLEQRFKLPPGYLAQTAQIESGGDPNALNKGSGAAGLFQFVPSTARQYGLSNPNDVLASSYAAARLASDNANVLRNALGRDPTAGELYLAHQQGAAGAAKLLAKANRDNWLAVKAQYYADHPVMSPFDPSKPLGAGDVQAINGSQQQTAPQSISSQDASALPVISSPDAAARLKPGTRFKTPDGRIMQR